MDNDALRFGKLTQLMEGWLRVSRFLSASMGPRTWSQDKTKTVKREIHETRPSPDDSKPSAPRGGPASWSTRSLKICTSALKRPGHRPNCRGNKLRDRTNGTSANRGSASLVVCSLTTLPARSVSWCGTGLANGK